MQVHRIVDSSPGFDDPGDLAGWSRQRFVMP
jgi:hypothetical protein